MEQIETFLAIPLWQFVSIIVAIFAFLVPILLYFLQRKQKALSFDVISTTPLLNIEEEEEGKLKILFENKQVLAPYMVILIVFNSGNVPITQTDYDEQVSFGFKAEKVLSAKVIETDPKGIKAKVDVSQNNVVLNPILLNGGDYIILKVFLEKYEDDFDVDGRIVGVKNIQQLKPNKKLFMYSAFLGALGPVAMLMGIIIMRYGTTYIGVILGLSGYILTVLGLRGMRRFKKMEEARKQR